MDSGRAVTKRNPEINANQLVDLYEIERLKAKYFRLMDLRMWTDFRDVFTDDFEFYLEDSPFPQSAAPPDISGGDAFVAFMAATNPDRTTVHHGFMPEISLTGDNTASGIWAMFDYISDPTADTTHRGYGHYYEQYVRGDDGRWRIREMRVTRLRVAQGPAEKHAGTSLSPERLLAVRHLDNRGSSVSGE